MNKGEHPAFPYNGTALGLSKREYFAAMAMQGLLSNPNIQRPHPNRGALDTQYYDFAKICLEYSDELLKQLES